MKSFSPGYRYLPIHNLLRLYFNHASFYKCNVEPKFSLARKEIIHRKFEIKYAVPVDYIH